MTILRKFPTEIHRQILELLPRKTVYQCILVCKHWSLLAIPVYYTTLTLSGKQIDFLNIKLLHHEQDQQFLHGKLVKVLKTPEFINENEISVEHRVEVEDFSMEEEDEDELSVGYEEDEDEEHTFELIPKFSSTTFLKLLSHLPNLKKIDLYSNAYYEFYMTILANYGKENLSKIQEIKNHFSFHQIHLTTCYEYRQTITHLELFSDRYCINYQMLEPIQILPYFTRLTNLKIINFEAGNDLTLFDILNVCPHLVSFEFESGCFVSKEKADASYRSMMDSRNTSRLEVLALFVPEMLTTYMHYITYNSFNLKSLTLNLFQTHFMKWMNTCNIKTLAAFINRLGKIDQLNFDTDITLSDKLVDEFNSMAFTKFTDILEFIQEHYPACYDLLEI